MTRFVSDLLDREGWLSLGQDTRTGSDYLAIPVTIGVVDYEEYYAITPQERSLFASSPEQRRAFADRCRARLEDDRLIVKPGWNRGMPF